MRTMFCQILRRLRCDERGVSLVIAGAALVALLGAAALAVDLGLAYSARTEAQRAADAGAHAGATHLVQVSGDSAGAAEAARTYALKNDIVNESTHEVDVAVDMEEDEVTATVYRTDSKGSAIGMWFARALGFENADVSADATAEVVIAGGVRCPLPLAIPDRWWEDAENNTDFPGPGDTFDPDSDSDDDKPDEYDKWTGEGDEVFSGYSDDSHGYRIGLTDFEGGGGDPNASWYYPWRPPGQQGASDYEQNIADCVDTNLTYEIGDTVETEPGAMVGPTKQGFRDLISQDPDAFWHTGTGDGHPETDHVDGKCGINCSPRIRPVPLFDPTMTPDPGNRPLVLTNYAFGFVEDIQGDSIYMRFMEYTGTIAVSDPDGAGASPLFKTVRLIE